MDVMYFILGTVFGVTYLIVFLLYKYIVSLHERIDILERNDSIDLEEDDDIISRKAAIDVVGLLRSPNKIKGRIASLPSLKKTGHWTNDHTTCSECGWQMVDDVLISPCMVFFNYCPNCGKRMIEDANENK